MRLIRPSHEEIRLLIDDVSSQAKGTYNLRNITINKGQDNPDSLFIKERNSNVKGKTPRRKRTSKNEVKKPKN